MEDQMAILGSRILLPDLVENTATAAKLRSMSETSDLATIIIILTKQINRLYEFTVTWAGAVSAEEDGIELDTNFLPKEMDAQLLTAMVGAWQATAFDRNVLNDNLLKAEIIDAETDLDEMLANIEAEEGDRMEKAAQSIANATEAAAGPEDSPNQNEEEDDGE